MEILKGDMWDEGIESVVRGDGHWVVLKLKKDVENITIDKTDIITLANNFNLHVYEGDSQLKGEG